VLPNLFRQRGAGELMLVVRIELWPKGDESTKRDLAVIAIANVGGDATAGDYEYAISNQAGTRYAGSLDPHELLAPPQGGKRPYWKRGKIVGFARSLGAVRLVHRVLRKALG
jgi:hypothetical protein